MNDRAADGRLNRRNSPAGGARMARTPPAGSMAAPRQRPASFDADRHLAAFARSAAVGAR